MNNNNYGNNYPGRGGIGGGRGGSHAGGGNFGSYRGRVHGGGGGGGSRQILYQSPNANHNQTNGFRQFEDLNQNQQLPPPSQPPPPPPPPSQPGGGPGGPSRTSTLVEDYMAITWDQPLKLRNPDTPTTDIVDREFLSKLVHGNVFGNCTHDLKVKVCPCQRSHAFTCTKCKSFYCTEMCARIPQVPTAPAGQAAAAAVTAAPAVVGAAGAANGILAALGHGRPCFDNRRNSSPSQQRTEPMVSSPRAAAVASTGSAERAEPPAAAAAAAVAGGQPTKNLSPPALLKPKTGSSRSEPSPTGAQTVYDNQSPGTKSLTGTSTSRQRPESSLSSPGQSGASTPCPLANSPMDVPIQSGPSSSSGSITPTPGGGGSGRGRGRGRGLSAFQTDASGPSGLNISPLPVESRIELEVGSNIQVTVTHPESPSEFFICRISDLEQMDQIELEIGKITNPASLLSPKVGDFCIAYFSGDEAGDEEAAGMYRARVIEAYPGSPTVKVQYIDFGNTSEQLRSELKRMPSNLLEIPAIANRVLVHHLAPSSTTSSTGSWSNEAIDYFKELVAGKPCNFHATKRAADYYTGTLSIDEVDICQEMVNAGFGEYFYSPTMHS